MLALIYEEEPGLEHQHPRISWWKDLQHTTMRHPACHREQTGTKQGFPSKQKRQTSNNTDCWKSLHTLEKENSVESERDRTKFVSIVSPSMGLVTEYTMIKIK